MKKIKYPATKDLQVLYDRVKSYCRAERNDKDVNSADMIEAWEEICKSVNVNPIPKWAR